MSCDARRAQRNLSWPAFESDQSAMLVRLGWMVLGPVVMLLACFAIAGMEPWTLSYFDLSFLGAAVLTALMRWVDIAKYHGTTSRGEPVNHRTLAWYLVGLSLVVVGSWVGAHSISIR